MRKLLFYLTTALIFFFTTFLFCEIGLRTWDNLKGVSPLYTHNFVENIAVPNGYFNFDIKPNITFLFDSKNPKKYSFNRWGFRAPEYDPIKPKNTIRMFFFGSSPTFDPYVSNEYSWTYLTGKKLSKRTKKSIEAINAGRYGYTSHEIFGLFYHRVLRHSPDLIILYLTVADADRKLSPYYGADDGPQIYGNPLLAMLRNRSAFFTWADFKLRHTNIFPGFINMLYKTVLPSNTYLKKPPQEHVDFISEKDRMLVYGIKLFKKNINTIINVAQDNNVKVLIATQLFKKEFRTKRPHLDLFTKSLRTISQEQNIPILDMYKLKLDNQLENQIMQTSHHLSPDGCEFLSGHMAEAISKSNLIDL